MREKTIQTYPYSNCTFHHQNSQRKQTSFTVPTNLIENFGQHNLLYVSLSAWKTGEKLCKNKHGENCIAQVVCWYFVRLCGAAGVGCEVSEGKKPSKPIHILTALFTTKLFTKKTNKFYRTNQPRENFGQHNLLYVSLSAWKTGQNPCKNKHGENCIAQVVCWYFVRLCGAAYTCNIAHISYVHILSAYVVCIFYLLFGVLATLAFFPYSICELEIFHILSPGLLLYIDT